MSDFQTMDDFAVFVNEYLTPDQLSVQPILMRQTNRSSLFL